jgi:hypothetical protein
VEVRLNLKELAVQDNLKLWAVPIAIVSLSQEIEIIILVALGTIELIKHGNYLNKDIQMPKPNDKRVEFRMPNDLVEDAKTWAYHLNISFSKFVRDAIEEKIERRQ